MSYLANNTPLFKRFGFTKRTSYQKYPSLNINDFFSKSITMSLDSPAFPLYIGSTSGAKMAKNITPTDLCTTYRLLFCCLLIYS